MQDRLKRVQDQFATFWNKYSSKQKTAIVGVCAGVIFAFALLTYILSRPEYETLSQTSDMEVADGIINELNENEIGYRNSVDNGVMFIEVEKQDVADATILLEGSGQYRATMTWSEALDTGIATTSEEKRQRNLLAQQASLAESLERYEGVREATVFVDKPRDEYSLWAEKENASVAVQLDLDGSAEVGSNVANAMALYLARAVGATDTSGITITTQTGDLLFSGSQEEGLGGSVNTTEEFRSRLRAQIGNNLQTIMVKNGFDDVVAATDNVVLNMDQVEILREEYSAPEGREEGMRSNDYHYINTNNSGSPGGIPGTDSNSEETDYMIEDGTAASGETEVTKNTYLPNKVVTNIKQEMGAIDTEASSISIVATRYQVISEETLEANGSLANMSFDEYVEANSQPLPLALPTPEDNRTMDDYVDLVANATGVSPNRITIMAQTLNKFQPSAPEASVFTVYNILMFLLAALIIAMMIFVVFRSTAPVEITEVEPELSIEQLLATTKENQSLEDIEFSEKSEARRMIEKFVDENPDAVAQLLRNWLNEDWG